MLPFPINLLTLWVVEVPLLYYLSMPVCRVLGVFDYLSAYTILYGNKRRGRLAVHLGMNYDLFWRLLPQRRTGERLIQTLQRDINHGMAELCHRIEKGEIRPDAVISVGSYFLNPRKLERLGMQRKGSSLIGAFNFLVAYPAIILDQLLLNGRVKLFNPFMVTTYSIPASKLAESRAYFERRTALEGS